MSGMKHDLYLLHRCIHPYDNKCVAVALSKIQEELVGLSGTPAIECIIDETLNSMQNDHG